MTDKLSVFKTVTKDSPIWRTPFHVLSSEAMVDFLGHIRSVRESAANKYKELVHRRAVSRSTRLAERLSDQIRMFGKDLEKLDKAIERIDKRITAVTAMRIELEDLDITEYITWKSELKNIPSPQDKQSS